MPVIAVAGGTGDVGRTLVEEISRDAANKVFVLTRKTKSGAPLKTASGDTPALGADYTDVSNLVSILVNNQIDTVISALNLHWPGAYDGQINLIRAASQSEVVKRFIPSEFNVAWDYPEEKMPYPPKGLYVKTVEELKQHPNLAYTLIRNGFFMDYLGLPFAETHMHPLYFILDLQAHKAVIPGDGKSYAVFTHTRDVGRFVAQLLKLEETKWPEQSKIIGDRITLVDVVKTAERITGSQFDIAYDTIEQLRMGVTHELPSNRSCYAYFPNGKEELDGILCTHMLGMANGLFDVTGDSLNEIFKNIRAINLHEFLTECWAKTI